MKKTPYDDKASNEWASMSRRSYWSNKQKTYREGYNEGLKASGLKCSDCGSIVSDIETAFIQCSKCLKDSLNI